MHLRRGINGGESGLKRRPSKRQSSGIRSRMSSVRKSVKDVDSSAVASVPKLDHERTTRLHEAAAAPPMVSNFTKGDDEEGTAMTEARRRELAKNAIVQPTHTVIEAPTFNYVAVGELSHIRAMAEAAEREAREQNEREKEFREKAAARKAQSIHSKHDWTVPPVTAGTNIETVIETPENTEDAPAGFEGLFEGTPEEEAAATLIQASFRGMMRRRPATNDVTEPKPHLSEGTEEENLAATKIQVSVWEALLSWLFCTRALLFAT